LVNHKIFNKQNLLNVKDFEELTNYKNNVVQQGTGAITIHGDGSKTVDTSVALERDGSTVWSDYNVSKEAIFNYTYNIDNYLPHIGIPFVKTIYAIQDALKSFGVNNPKCYMSRAYRNNQITVWHKHSKPDNCKPSNFWVTIMYLHPNWDTSFGGDIEIGIIEQEPIYKFPCYSNSIVAHNGYYGHAVNYLKSGYVGDRDILLNHWISE